MYNSEMNSSLVCVINTRRINLKSVGTHDYVNKQIRVPWCFWVSTYEQQATPPPPITPLVIRDDATLPPPGVKCDVDMVWHGRSPGGKRCRRGSAPPRILIPGEWWTAVWRVVVFGCMGQWVFGGGTEDGLCWDSGALAQVKEPETSDLTNKQTQQRLVYIWRWREERDPFVWGDVTVTEYRVSEQDGHKSPTLQLIIASL